MGEGHGASSTKINRVKRFYDSQVGVREQGTNAGKKVEAYLAYVGLGKGHAWCAAFVCWVYEQAGIPNPRTAWSPSLFPSSKVIWRNQAGLSLKNQKKPRRGDVFGIYYRDKKRIAHAGFIDQWQDKWIITVEGNTNPDGYREGDGVYRKKRLISSVYSVARYIP